MVIKRKSQNAIYDALSKSHHNCCHLRKFALLVNVMAVSTHILKKFLYPLPICFTIVCLFFYSHYYIYHIFLCLYINAMCSFSFCACMATTFDCYTMTLTDDDMKKFNGRFKARTHDWI